MRHSLDSKLLQELLNYLVTRPFNEVNPLIQLIQKDAKIVEGSAPAAEAEEAATA